MQDAFLRPLGDLIALALRHRSRPRLAFTRVQIGRIVITGDITMQRVPNNMKTILSIAPHDAYEQASLVDGSPVWTNNDPSKATLTPAADGLTAEFEPVGPVTEPDVPLQVFVTADADMSDGVRQIQGLLEVEIVSSDTVSIGITAGPLEPRVAAPPAEV